MSAFHRFKCPCGKVNQFKVPDGPARSVKACCGSCQQVCRMDVPATDAAQSVRELLEKIGLGGGLDGLFGLPRR